MPIRARVAKCGALKISSKEENVDWVEEVERTIKNTFPDHKIRLKAKELSIEESFISLKNVTSFLQTIVKKIDKEHRTGFLTTVETIKNVRLNIEKSLKEIN